jgi:hypothetical protein
MLQLNDWDDIYIWNDIDSSMGPMLKVTYLGNLYNDERNLYKYKNHQLELPATYFDEQGNSNEGSISKSMHNSSLTIKQHIYVANDYPMMNLDQLNTIYYKAYEQGHSSGEYEVNLYFEELITFVDKVMKMS